MTKIEVVSRIGRIIDIIDRNIQKGEKGKQFIIYKNKQYIVEKDRFGILSIFPWGYIGEKHK